jgi:hypothetical protein
MPQREVGRGRNACEATCSAASGRLCEEADLVVLSGVIVGRGFLFSREARLSLTFDSFIILLRLCPPFVERFLTALAPFDSSCPLKTKFRATDAKEVGVGNPAEETSATRTKPLSIASL